MKPISVTVTVVSVPVVTSVGPTVTEML